MESIEDSNRKYGKSFFWYDGIGPVYVNEIFMGEEENQYFLGESSAGQVDGIKWDSSKIVLAKTPFGLVNHRGRVLLIQNNGQRQWRRGFNNSAFSIKDLTMAYQKTLLDFRYPREICKTTGFSWGAPASETLEILSPSYHSLKDAISLVLSGKCFGTAIDSEYAIFPKLNSEEDFMLVRKENIIGHFNPSTGKAVIENPIFTQEILDFFEKEMFDVRL